MSSFGRAFHAENEEHPVFTDDLAKELMTAEEYDAVQGYIRGGARFFEPEIDPAKQETKELLRRLVNVHIAPSLLCRAAYTEQALKTAVLTGTKQYVILGAGMDTFAFREPEFLSKHRVFEVDHPMTQKDKQSMSITVLLSGKIRVYGGHDEKHGYIDRLLRTGLRKVRRQNRNDYKRQRPA